MTIDIRIGDCRKLIRDLPDESADLCVTSPPYLGLRDYGVDGQIGLEATPEEHLEVLVGLFREVRRVLKPHGTLWLNYGDCYATTPNGRSAADIKSLGNDDRTFPDKPVSTIGGIYKSKDLMMLPNRLAIALHADGWWVRSEIIWGKPNAMPDSSASQRPAVAHEKIFLLAKSGDADVWRARDTGELSCGPDLAETCPFITDPARLGPRWLRIGAYYDANAVLQGRAGDEDANGYRGGSYTNGRPGPRAATGNIRGRSTSGRHTLGDAIPLQQRRTKSPDASDTGPGGHGSFHRKGREQGKTRAVSPRHPGHINHTGIANTPRGESRYLRNYEPAPLSVWEMAIQPFGDAHFATFPEQLAERCVLAGCPVGGMVLDPFMGAGTVALVAERHGMNSIGFEINPEYAEIARNRILCERQVKIVGMPAPKMCGLPLLDAIAEAAE